MTYGNKLTGLKAIVGTVKKATAGSSYEIQRIQVKKRVKELLLKFPYVLTNKNILLQDVLKLIEEENYDWDQIFELIDEIGIHAVVDQLFPHKRISNRKLNVSLFMANIELSRVYRNKTTSQKVITYATARHNKENQATNLKVVIYRDANNPQPEYESMKVSEFLEYFEEVII